MDKLAEQVIIDILTNQMGLDPQRIWVRDQNKKIPPDDNLFITVGMADASPMSVQNYMETRTLPPVPPSEDPTVQEVEIIRTQLREIHQVDILSRNTDAITRRWEILAALGSIYAQQQQEKYVFKIGKLPTTFVNASSAEGGSQLNRFSLLFACFVWYKKEIALNPNGSEFYDDFTTRVDDAKTIGEPEGLIEFEIKGETIT